MLVATFHKVNAGLYIEDCGYKNFQHYEVKIL